MSTIRYMPARWLTQEQQAPKKMITIFKHAM